MARIFCGRGYRPAIRRLPVGVRCTYTYGYDYGAFQALAYAPTARTANGHVSRHVPTLDLAYAPTAHTARFTKVISTIRRFATYKCGLLGISASALKGRNVSARGEA